MEELIYYVRNYHDKKIRQTPTTGPPVYATYKRS